tara:strand:- start:6355 stop:7284 length:930 start_codon:yes stop_codon:yes gene_type:complete
MKTSKLRIFTFYKFIKIINLNEVKSLLDDFCKDKMLRGTILLANEGINASISGREQDLMDLVKEIKILLKVTDLNIINNLIKFLPFNKMKVRIKKEIVSLGKDEINIPKYTGKFVSPENWNKIINRKNIKLIDIRNKYEFNIGHFKNAINPKTKSFRDFPKKISKLGIKKDDDIVMYCTGGIRCEKISAFLKTEGYSSVAQLKGGILNFLEHSKDSKDNDSWIGECFVFDNRVALDKRLETGSYDQCYGCRHPITKNDKSLKSYQKGISCRYCYNKRSHKQIKSSTTRQDQIDKAERDKLNHPFSRINH